MRAVDAIEDRDLSSSFTEVYFHARNGGHYRLVYKQKGVVLDVRLKRLRDEFCWIIEEAPEKKVQGQTQVQKSAVTAEAVKKIFSGRGTGWRGLASCIKANLHEGLEDALLRVDEAVRSEVAGEASGSLQKSVANGGAFAKVKTEVITLE